METSLPAWQRAPPANSAYPQLRRYRNPARERSSPISRNYDIVKTPQDLRYLTWDEVRCPSGLGGTRAKAREGTGCNAVFYRLSGKGPLGQNHHDAFAELICSRLMEELGIPHIAVQLIRARIEGGLEPCWVIRSRNFLERGETSMPFDRFFELRAQHGESPMQLCLRMGWKRQLADMAIADYLSATRGRKAQTMEVVRKANGRLQLSPLAPLAFSLVNSFPMDTWRRFCTYDINTENCIGSASLEENLELVDPAFRLPEPTASVRKRIVGDLKGLGADDFVDASWQIIEGRWRHFESLRRL